MIYGYARVSSLGQAKDGNSLEAQCAVLKEHGCTEIYSEAFTGMTNARPEFEKLLARLVSGDTLIVAKLDRFSRSAVEGVTLIKELHERGIIVEILNMGRADNSPMGKLMVTMLLAFAEFEHDQIIERLSVGKAVAKSHGKKTDGRYTISIPNFEDYVKKCEHGQLSVTQACKDLGISRGTYYGRLKALKG